jgi:hypothetical protein
MENTLRLEELNHLLRDAHPRGVRRVTPGLIDRGLTRGEAMTKVLEDCGSVLRLRSCWDGLWGPTKLVCDPPRGTPITPGRAITTRS